MMRGSNSNGNLENSASLQSELESLLLQQQRNRALILERERDLDINRSGSAPPTVEGALGAATSLFRPLNLSQSGSSGTGSGGSSNPGIDFLTEDEIRSHPAYLEYYYSHDNLNPRLPPPSLSREDWRVAQRVRASGLQGLGRNSVDNGGISSSLFSMQPNLSAAKAEDQLMELRKTALRNLSRQSSAESLEKCSAGLGSGLGVRRKSFADILQEGRAQPLKSHASCSADILEPMGLSNPNAVELRNKSDSFEAMLSVKAFSANNSSCSRSEMVGRSHNPRAVALGNGVRVADNHTKSRQLDARNFPSSGIFEIADLSSSLSGLSMPKSQIRNEDVSRMGIPPGYKQNQQLHYGDNNINFANLVNNGSTRGINISKPVTNDRVGFPRRTSSTSNLQCDNFPGANISSHRRGGYSVNQEPDRMINNDIASGSFLHAMDPHQIQYMQKMSNQGRDLSRVLGNSFQGGIHLVGGPHGHEDLALEKAYLEALLLQQAQQYQAHSLQKLHGSINHQFHGNPSFVPPYLGNLLLNSQNSGVGGGTSVMLNEKNTQMPSNSRGLKGESGSSLHSQNGGNAKGRFESLLEVLKNKKSKSLELPDILGHVVEFSTDQFGSRFIQQKLETASEEEKMKVLAEIIPHARALMIDVFGNYVIQKFFEHGTESQRKELATHLIGHVLPLTLQMYGCRVIQKALEVVDLELQVEMVAELDGSVMKCVHDQNGNHVIQKCIECIPQDHIQFIISSFFGQIVTLSTHPYGCRVIQRVLEHCDDSKTQATIMDEIMNFVCKLAQDQYGNYVIQHVVQHGKPHERSAIISKLAGQIVKMSQQKFASNVVEKCLIYGGPEERQLLVNEMLGSTDENEPLQAMMKDPFGNYVVQKVLETCDDKNRELILSRIKVHLNTLKRYTYGKHIVSRVEKLVAAGERHVGKSSSNS